MKYTQLKTTEFNQLVNGFEKELIKENKGECFLSETLSYTKEFLSYVEESGTTSMKTLTQQTVNNYFTYLEKERQNKQRGGTLSTSTIRKHQSAIRNYFNYLQIEEQPVNAIKLKKIKRGTKKNSIALSHKEIEQLYAVTDDSALGSRDRCMLALYYGCGMRKSEGLQLLLTDIDFSRGRIHIRKTKTNRERYVMMSPTVQKQIEDYVYSGRDMYQSEESPYQQVLISERGAPMHPATIAHRMDILWKRVKDNYGNEKEMGCHTLRHTLGTHLYMAGMNIKDVALMLGHRTLESTQLYIHLANQLKNNNYEQI